MPSSISLTLVTEYRPTGPSARRATSASIWSRPPSCSHHSAPATRAVSAPRPATEQVRRVDLGRDDRVLPVRDPDAVEVRLAREERLLALRGRRRRDEALHQVLRALVERAQRRAVRVAGDAPVVGVGRVGGDAGELQRPAVDPRVVPVLVGQEHGPIGDDAVEVLPAREAVGEVGEVPAGAQDPRDVRVGGGVGRDPLQVLVDAARVHEVAVQLVDARRDRVDMRIAEPGGDGPPAEVDDARARPDQGRHVAVAADGDEPAVAHGDGLGPGDRGVGGEHLAAGEDEVGVARSHADEDARGATTPVPASRRAA